MKDWKRLATILDMRAAGQRYLDIGLQLGISTGRAAELDHFCDRYGVDRVRLKANSMDQWAFDREKRLIEIRRFNRGLRTRAKTRGLAYP